MNKQTENYSSCYLLCFGLCALDEGRTAISMGRETGNGEGNTRKLDFMIAHGRWGEARIGRNCCSAPQMSGRAAIHGTFSIIGRRG